MSRIDELFGSRTNLKIGKTAKKRCVFGLKFCSLSIDGRELMRRPGEMQQAPFKEISIRLLYICIPTTKLSITKIFRNQS